MDGPWSAWNFNAWGSLRGVEEAVRIYIERATR